MEFVSQKEQNVKKWLNNICAEEIVSLPMRCVLGLEENKTLVQVPNFCIQHLNKTQQLVFHSDYFKYVEVIEGPPGTGKTTVISTLLDYIDANFRDKENI